MWDAAASGVRFAPSEPSTPPITTASSSSKSSRSVTGGRTGSPGPEHGVRVREVEGRRLVPLAARPRSCRRRRRSTPSTCSSNVTKSRIAAGTSGASSCTSASGVARSLSSDRANARARHPAPAPSTSATVSPSGNGTTRSSMTKPSPMRRPVEPPRDPHARTSVSSSASALPPRMRSVSSAGRPAPRTSETGSSRPMSNG